MYSWSLECGVCGLVGGEGQISKTLLSRGESQLVLRVGGGAVILVKLLLVASNQLL